MPQPPRKRPQYQAKKAWKHSGPRPGGGNPGYSAPKRPAPKKDSREQGWDQVAGWYDKLVGDRGSDYHRNVILPAAMRLLAPSPGERSSISAVAKESSSRSCSKQRSPRSPASMPAPA